MAESFEQDEPFTVRLSGILNEYPPGVSTLKELLQNADDAGARVIVFPVLTIYLIIRLILLTHPGIPRKILLTQHSKNIRVRHC